jgi:hypothetical protein
MLVKKKIVTVLHLSTIVIFILSAGSEFFLCITYAVGSVFVKTLPLRGRVSI